MRGIFISAVASVILAGPALAASPMGQLREIDGKVYVNQGEGFVPARGNVELFQGDRVMVGENASATINYYVADCDFMLSASSMTTIPGKAPCTGGSQTSTEGLVFPSGSPSAGGLVVTGIGVVGMGTLGIVAGTNDEKPDTGQSP
jgi:hypothetical protein